MNMLYSLKEKKNLFTLGGDKFSFGTTMEY